MTRYAIFADVHGRLENLQAVLQDAKQQGATAFIDLGDVGSDACCTLLRQANVEAVFGNYEVTRWDRLSPENQAWVRQLGPLLAGETFLAAHAVPYLPSHLYTVHDMLDYILKHENVTWNTLFPRLDKSEEARWLAYAELVERNKRVFFHGHTHVQAVWRIGASGRMTVLHKTPLVLDNYGRYLVGVGSVGQPQDGPEPRYALYDVENRSVTLMKLT